MECTKAQGEPFMWQSCLIPSPLLRTMWRMGEGSQPYSNSLSWFAIGTAPSQHLFELQALNGAQANTWDQGFLSKSQQENKDFFSSPTLHLAAFHHSYGKGEENPHPFRTGCWEGHSYWWPSRYSWLCSELVSISPTTLLRGVWIPLPGRRGEWNPSNTAASTNSFICKHGN